MTPAYNVRAAAPGDLDAAAALYDALCRHLEATFNYPCWKLGVYPTRETAESALSNGELFLCTDGEDVLGTCILNGTQPAGYEEIPWQVGIAPGEVLVLHTLAVHPAHLRQGVSGALLRFAETYAEQQGKRTIRLDVFEQNLPGVRLYERYGYRMAEKTDLHLVGDGQQISHCYEKIIEKGETIC